MTTCADCFYVTVDVNISRDVSISRDAHCISIWNETARLCIQYSPASAVDGDIHDEVGTVYPLGAKVNIVQNVWLCVAGHGFTHEFLNGQLLHLYYWKTTAPYGTFSLSDHTFTHGIRWHENRKYQIPIPVCVLSSLTVCMFLGSFRDSHHKAQLTMLLSMTLLHIALGRGI